MSQKEIVDAVCRLHDECQVADIWHSTDTIAQLLNVSTMALNKAQALASEFAQIDMQNNKIGVVQFKKQIQKNVNNNNTQSVKCHFLYFAHRKTPTFFTGTATWTKLYRRSAEFKLAPRSKQLRTVVAVSPTAFSLRPPKKRQRCITAAAPTPFDIFNDTKTKTLFNCKNRADLQDRINRMRTAVQHHTITAFLSSPHKKRENERLPAYNVLFLYSKLLALTLAYDIAVEEHCGQCSWKDCCTKAADQMKQCSLTAFSPLTVMKWNRSFRMTETFPHSFECQKQSKPIIFRVYPEAETIARHGIQKLLKREALCCETAAAFFGGEFIDRVLAKEYQDDRRAISPGDKKRDFRGIVREAMEQVTKVHMRKFCYLTRRYLVGYIAFGEETSVEYDAIERFQGLVKPTDQPWTWMQVTSNGCW
jgi:hypothetical protein